MHDLGVYKEGLPFAQDLSLGLFMFSNEFTLFAVPLDFPLLIAFLFFVHSF